MSKCANCWHSATKKVTLSPGSGSQSDNYGFRCYSYSWLFCNEHAHELTTIYNARGDTVEVETITPEVLRVERQERNEAISSFAIAMLGFVAVMVALSAFWAGLDMLGLVAPVFLVLIVVIVFSHDRSAP